MAIRVLETRKTALADLDHITLTARRTSWGRPIAAERRQQKRDVTVLEPSALGHAVLADMHARWLAACSAEDQTPPSRDTFQPETLRGALGRIMIVEREPDGDGFTYRYRLVGTEIVQTFGEDFTGKTIEIFHAPLRAMVRRQFDDAFALGAPHASRIRSVVDNLRYDYEKLILPIRSRRDGPVDQAVVSSFQVDKRGS